MTTKDEARAAVAELAARFRALTPAQVRDTNEEATKQGYILPLFHALENPPEFPDIKKWHASGYGGKINIPGSYMRALVRTKYKEMDRQRPLHHSMYPCFI